MITFWTTGRFRRAGHKSVKQVKVDCHSLIAFLRENSISITNEDIVVLIGRSGSGKTSVATCLANNYGFAHLEMSMIAKDLRHQHGLDHLRLREFVNVTSRNSSSDHIIRRLHSLGLLAKGKIVISGVRHTDEINYLKEHVPEMRVLIVYLQCGVVRRWLRVIRRKGIRSGWDFVMDELYSVRWGDLKLKQLASILLNSSSGMIRVNYQK